MTPPLLRTLRKQVGVFCVIMLNEKKTVRKFKIQTRRHMGRERDDEVFNALIPVYGRKLRGLYLHCLHWFEHLKHDRVHKDVMKTRHRFMEEDSMDVEEATDAAVERRKFLLNRMFQPRPIPTQEEEEEENEDDN